MVLQQTSMKKRQHKIRSANCGSYEHQMQMCNKHKFNGIKLKYFTAENF